MRGDWPDTLGDLRCHPLVDLLGGWRSNQSEPAEALLILFSFRFEHSKLRFLPATHMLV
jgi:hypothetical protein